MTQEQALKDLKSLGLDVIGIRMPKISPADFPDEYQIECELLEPGYGIYRANFNGTIVSVQEGITRGRPFVDCPGVGPQRFDGFNLRHFSSLADFVANRPNAGQCHIYDPLNLIQLVSVPVYPIVATVRVPD